jgi:peptidoglycan hydrolase CwlO-like protein
MAAPNTTKIDLEIKQSQDKLVTLNQKIEQLNQAINDNQNMMVQTEENIKNTQNDLNNLKKEIAIIQKRIDQRNEILKNRAKSIQENGSTVNYIDVLLGAHSFDDFVERVTAVTTIVDADRDLISEHKKDIASVQEKQQSAEQKLKDLQDTKTELEGMREQIAEQKASSDALKDELKKEEQSKLAEKDTILKAAAKATSTPVAKQEQTTTTNVSQKSQTDQRDLPVSPSPAPVSTPAPGGGIQTAMTAGFKYIGHSVYVFGGGRSAYDIANGRFDCSGFVHWAFSQAGVNIGTSTESLKNQGTRVSYSDIRPGDLVFFNTYKQDGHVGIYLGNGQFIGSQSSTGVAVANMSSGYWRDHFSGHVQRIM